jgi:hypothetical protein
MQDTANQNAAGFLPVKDNMLALLHAPQPRANFITRATERGIIGKSEVRDQKSGEADRSPCGRIGAGSRVRQEKKEHTNRGSRQRPHIPILRYVSPVS